jgi:deferrochelatase/peroxidase EfeB
MLLLDSTGTEAKPVAAQLEKLWRLYDELKQGFVPDLKPASVPGGNLDVLVGYGAPAFRLNGVSALRPPASHEWDTNQFDPIPTVADGAVPPRSIFRAKDDVGDPVLARRQSSWIEYDAGIEHNPAEAAVAIQFTADTPLAVERAVIETWKKLRDTRKPGLVITAAFRGSQRDDGRSWLDFHDGLSNIRPADREEVIFVQPSGPDGSWAPDEAWLEQGTYMAFMRLSIDLELWRGLKLSKQQEFVGRRRVSGCPIANVAEASRSDPESNPMPPGWQYVPDPPHEVDHTIGAKNRRNPILDSHVQRVNHGNPLKRRIFRQGYPYFESSAAVPWVPQIGLNFVSFQNQPSQLMDILMSQGWLGGVNFAGPLPGATKKRFGDGLIKALAAGMFVVPPEESPFPGYGILS